MQQTIDIQAWLEADRSTPYSERVKRDRALGQQFSVTGDIPKVLHWWRMLPGSQLMREGAAVVRYRRRIRHGLWLFGILSGLSLCRAGLSLAGSYPVNLLGFVGGLVGLPLVLFVMTVVASTLRSLGSQKLSHWMNTINLNIGLIGLWDKLGGGRFAAGFGQRDGRGRLAYWQLISFSQSFAMAFFFGVLAMFLAQLATTDLTFGWRTTLALQAQSVHGVFYVIAQPWAWIWPAAVPDIELVNVSRYFRLEPEIGQARAEQLSQWWPFVLMTVLVWGLLPRLLLSAWANWRLNVATYEFLREHSEVTALLDRLNSAWLVFGGKDAEPDACAAEVESPSPADPLPAVAVTSALLIWNEALPRNRALQKYPSAVFISTWQSDEDKRALLENLTVSSTSLTLLVKSWEPPLLEFDDFLALLREVLGRDRTVVIVPVAMNGAQVAPVDLTVWMQATERLRDARIYVAGTLIGEVL